MSDVPRLAAAGLPLQFPSAFAAVHAAIPVDQRTHEGRYVWEPRLHPFPHAPAAGLLSLLLSPVELALAPKITRSVACIIITTGPTCRALRRGHSVNISSPISWRALTKGRSSSFRRSNWRVSSLIAFRLSVGLRTTAFAGRGREEGEGDGEMLGSSIRTGAFAPGPCIGEGCLRVEQVERSWKTGSGRREQTCLCALRDLG
ncbi:hypothetical protein HPB51_012095 [Rhipicephalus microplus]|uniref:Uncharacterized protein n=1 Tax=Rhipicephalus microplus TaxID=6941 RepID=A0A9J6DMT5_RHIMP|nr:hypothetical protein HPB51_012095 [Rhipicephalus microplus]